MSRSFKRTSERREANLTDCDGEALGARTWAAGQEKESTSAREGTTVTVTPPPLTPAGRGSESSDEKSLLKPFRDDAPASPEQRKEERRAENHQSGWLQASVVCDR